MSMQLYLSCRGADVGGGRKRCLICGVQLLKNNRRYCYDCLEKIRGSAKGGSLFRFLHKWYARLNGYFWLPCPICGRMFGGHEVSHGPDQTLWETRFSGTCVCKKCKGEAQRRNKVNNLDSDSRVNRSNGVCVPSRTFRG